MKHPPIARQWISRVDILPFSSPRVYLCGHTESSWNWPFIKETKEKHVRSLKKELCGSKVTTFTLSDCHLFFECDVVLKTVSLLQCIAVVKIFGPWFSTNFDVVSGSQKSAERVLPFDDLPSKTRKNNEKQIKTLHYCIAWRLNHRNCDWYVNILPRVLEKATRKTLSK